MQSVPNAIFMLWLLLLFLSTRNQKGLNRFASCGWRCDGDDRIREEEAVLRLMGGRGVDVEGLMARYANKCCGNIYTIWCDEKGGEGDSDVHKYASQHPIPHTTRLPTFICCSYTHSFVRVCVCVLYRSLAPLACHKHSHLAPFSRAHSTYASRAQYEGTL